MLNSTEKNHPDGYEVLRMLNSLKNASKKKHPVVDQYRLGIQGSRDKMGIR